MFHHLLLHPPILLGAAQGPQPGRQVEIIDQEHLAGEVLIGEEWDGGGPPHFPVVLIQLEGHGVLQGMCCGSPVPCKVFHLKNTKQI